MRKPTNNYRNKHQNVISKSTKFEHNGNQVKGLGGTYNFGHVRYSYSVMGLVSRNCH